MVGSVNKVILLGRLGKDPDIRSMQNGKKIANFSIATSKRWTDRDTQEKKEKTSWHNVVVFNEGLVGIVEQYVKKGSQIYVEGELQTRKWQDQQYETRPDTRESRRKCCGAGDGAGERFGSGSLLTLGLARSPGLHIVLMLSRADTAGARCCVLCVL